MLFDEKQLKTLVAGKSREEILGEGGILKGLVKSLIEAAMNAELDHHLGCDKHEKRRPGMDNARNGRRSKKLKGDFGEAEIMVPRDRDASFEPKIVAKGQRRWDGFDDKIIAMYSRGMSTRDMQSALKEMYGVDVSPTLISDVTDAVMDDVRTWQSRTLDAVYPIVYFDAIVVKVHDNKRIVNKAELNLASFVEKWDKKYSSISTSWQRHWLNIITFFDYPPEIRKVIYTTNAIESLNMTVRKVIKNKRAFPSDDSMLKLVYLALKNIEKKWTMPIRDWGLAANRFSIEFGDRFTQ